MIYILNIYIYIYIYTQLTMALMSATIHTQQQSLCYLALTRVKEEPLEENAVLPDTETNEPAYPSFFN